MIIVNSSKKTRVSLENLHTSGLKEYKTLLDYADHMDILPRSLM